MKIDVVEDEVKQFSALDMINSQLDCIGRQTGLHKLDSSITDGYTDFTEDRDDPRACTADFQEDAEYDR